MDRDVTSLLEKLSSKLGTTVEHLWSILIKQAAISGICNIVFGIVIVIFSFGCFYLTQLVYSNVDKGVWDNTGYFAPAITWIIDIVLVICWFCELPTTIACFVNEEYFALSEIKDIIKSAAAKE